MYTEDNDNVNSGYVIIWRKLSENPIIRDHKLFVVLIWCILKASFKDHKCNKIMLKRGQFFTGQHVASKELGMSSSMFRRKLLELVKLDVVTTKVVNRFTLVTVCKYDTYQNVKDAELVKSMEHNYSRRNGRRTTTTVVEKRESKAPTPNLVKYFYAEYLKTFGKQYVPNWAKDGACMKRLIDSGLTHADIIVAIDRYLRDTDYWITDHGHTIGIFASSDKINQYVVRLQPEPLSTYERPEDRKHGELPQFTLDRLKKIDEANEKRRQEQA